MWCLKNTWYSTFTFTQVWVSSTLYISGGCSLWVGVNVCCMLWVTHGPSSHLPGSELQWVERATPLGYIVKYSAVFWLVLSALFSKHYTQLTESHTQFTEYLTSSAKWNTLVETIRFFIKTHFVTIGNTHISCNYILLEAVTLSCDKSKTILALLIHNARFISLYSVWTSYTLWQTQKHCYFPMITLGYCKQSTQR